MYSRWKNNRYRRYIKRNGRLYLQAMTLSVADASRIKSLIAAALTDKIDDREMFMKGIDYSYYYEQEDNL